MQNEDLKPEMEVLVNYGGSWKPAKVIGPQTENSGGVFKIIGWKVAIEPSALGITVTADKIHARG